MSSSSDQPGMPLSEFAKRVFVFLSVVLFFFLLVTFVKSAITIILIIFSAILVAIVFYWLSIQLQQLIKIPHIAALIIVVVITMGVLTTSGIFVAPKVYEQGKVLAVKVPNAFYSLQIYLLQYDWGEEFIQTVIPDGLKDDQDPPSEQEQTEQQEQMNQWVKAAFGIFGSALNILVGFLIVIILAVYIAYEPGVYLRGFIRLFPLSYRERIHYVFQETGTTLRWWMAGQLVSMTVVGILTLIVLSIFNVPLALVLAVVTGFTTLIPIIGATLGLIPALAMALTVSPHTGLMVTIFYIIIQNIEGNFLTPIIHRKSISLPPVLILVVQMILLQIIGVFGVLLAMPIIASLMVFVRLFYIEDVLGDYPENS